MHTVNKNIIRQFNPCDDGYENYLKHYSDFNGSLKEFLDLKKIPYYDKIWLASKFLTKNQAVSWSIKCAESVLSLFEKEYPDDARPRRCLEYLKSLEDFENLTENQLKEIKEHRDYAWSAAWSATDSAAGFVGYVSSAAGFARAAAGSTRFAIRSTEAARSAEKEQENKNLEFLKSVL